MGSSPGDSDFFSYQEFFLSLSFLPVDSAEKRVYTAGKRWLILFPQSKYQSVPHKDGNGRPQGEEPCDVTTVQMFRQDARRGKAPFELWKCEGEKKP